MDEDVGEKVDSAMSVLSNRLPFMSLDDICKQEGYSFAAVWRSCGLSKHDAHRVGPTRKPVECLTCDVHASYGDFALKCDGWELTASGGTSSKDGELIKGESLAWKCYTSNAKEKVEHFENLQTSGDPRKMIAKDLDVKGCFAIFRDGAVYEFGGINKMEAQPEKLISGIGGSTGVRAASKVGARTAIRDPTSHTFAPLSNRRHSNLVCNPAGGASCGAPGPDVARVEDGCDKGDGHGRSGVRGEATMCLPRMCPRLE